MLIAKLKTEVRYMEEAIEHLVLQDLGLDPLVAILSKRKKVLKKTIRQLEKLEAKRNKLEDYNYVRS